MNGFWQTVLGSLAAAAITGLTILAYRHPIAYRRLYLPLVCIVWGVAAAWFVFNLGFIVGFGQGVIETLKLNSPTFIKTPSFGFTHWWYFFVPTVVYAYLSLLRFLPELLSSENPEANEK